MCSPNKPKAQEGLCPLAHKLQDNQDQENIQIYDTKTDALTKEQNGFSKSSENHTSCGQPKLQNHPLIKFILPNKMH